MTDAIHCAIIRLLFMNLNYLFELSQSVVLKIWKFAGPVIRRLTLLYVSFRKSRNLLVRFGIGRSESV